jgi:hypothetical protein
MGFDDIQPIGSGVVFQWVTHVFWIVKSESDVMDGNLVGQCSIAVFPAAIPNTVPLQ